ncbi:MAG: cytochrome c oxidase subunit 3 family protein, partial [Deltaproteobacteria bacterium]
KEQFDDLEQQHEAANFGMWIFLATEVMFFGGLFAGYTIFRNLYPADFAAGSHLLHVKFGATNTAVLICSSLTMALAVRAAQTGKRRQLIFFLAATLILGLAFLGIKLTQEWGPDLREGFVPGLDFSGAAGKLAELTRLGELQGYSSLPHVELFMVFYFFMTGVHALHMVIGAGILGILLVGAWKGKFGPDSFNAIEMSGLYWHFVDVIWIFLFPLLYLLGGRY